VGALATRDTDEILLPTACVVSESPATCWSAEQFETSMDPQVCAFRKPAEARRFKLFGTSTIVSGRQVHVT
jgi:hypothetical protein